VKMSRRIVDLNCLPMLPSIRTWICFGDLNIGSLSFDCRLDDSQALVALLLHCGISLAVSCEPHHQLWNT